MAGDDDPWAGLGAWAADARAEEAARSKARERWLRDQAAEDACFTDLLRDLSDVRATVVVRTTAGRAVSGRLGEVGEDFCAIAGAGAVAVVFVAVAAVAEVRSRTVLTPGPRAGGGPGRRLQEVLAERASDRPRLQVVTGGRPVTGELLAVGRDLVTLRVEGEVGQAYVRLDSVSEVSLFESGPFESGPFESG